MLHDFRTSFPKRIMYETRWLPVLFGYSTALFQLPKEIQSSPLQDKKGEWIKTGTRHTWTVLKESGNWLDSGKPRHQIASQHVSGQTTGGSHAFHLHRSVHLQALQTETTAQAMLFCNTTRRLHCWQSDCSHTEDAFEAGRLQQVSLNAGGLWEQIG